MHDTSLYGGYVSLCPAQSVSWLLLLLEIGPMVGERTLSSEEFAGDVQGFTSDNDNLLAVQKLLCDRAG